MECHANATILNPLEEPDVFEILLEKKRKIKITVQQNFIKYIDTQITQIFTYVHAYIDTQLYRYIDKCICQIDKYIDTDIGIQIHRYTDIDGYVGR